MKMENKNKIGILPVYKCNVSNIYQDKLNF